MRILLIDYFPEEMLEELRFNGLSFEYQPDWTAEEIYENCGEVEILVMNSKIKADAKLLEVAPKLKMVCRAGVGMDHFDLPMLEEKGILAVNTPGANAIPVAEQALGMLLTLLHNISRADSQVKRLEWKREENRGTELTGKTVGIIGYGHTGSAFARLLAGFNCKVLAYDKYKSGFANSYVEEVGLDRIFEEAEILTLHIPLTNETKNWIDAPFFSRFKRPIWFLNLSRGPIVPLKGLYQALEAGNVISAGLDVLENEKLHTLSDSQKLDLTRLFETDRVLFTPHIGGWSHESLKRINSQLVKEIAGFVKQSN